jgi:hypothetical protein
MAKKKAVNGKKAAPGISLERAVARIQQLMDPDSKVTHNEWIVDRVGNKRQYDVVIRGRFGGREMLGIIECKDENKRKGPSAVEAFAKKTENLGANLRLMVSRRGFTEQALKLALHEHIGCLSIVPNDEKLAGFTLGQFAFGILRRWTDVYFAIQFPTASPPVSGFSSESLTWNGLPAFRWFLRELFTKYAGDQPSGIYKLQLLFYRAETMEINGTPYPIRGITCHCKWVVAKKRKWMSWTGDAFYDWHNGRITIPANTVLTGGPIETDFSLWDDYDGEIPKTPAEVAPQSIALIGIFTQSLPKDQAVPELGPLGECRFLQLLAPGTLESK